MKKEFIQILIISAISVKFLFAQGNWNVDPMIFNLTPSCGDTLTQFFTVYNKGEEATSFKIYFSDWTFTEEGHTLELEPGSQVRGCAGWLTSSPQIFTIGPKSSQIVRFTMVVPDTSKSGSYCGDVFVEPTEKPKLASKMNGKGRSLSIFLKIRAKISINVTLNQHRPVRFLHESNYVVFFYEIF
jgi:hypothetical protein